PPAGEAVVNGLPFAVALGHVAPWRARAKDPKDAIEYLAMRHPGAPLFVGPFRGKKWLEEFVLFIGEFVAGHESSSTGELASARQGPMNNVQLDLSDTA